LLPDQEGHLAGRLLAFWQETLGGPLHSVKVAHSRPIKPVELRNINEEFCLH
jgi:uncharacterized protein Usg